MNRRFSKKIICLISFLCILEISLVYLSTKSYQNKEVDITTTKEIKKELFSTFIENQNGEYEKYVSTDGSLVPNGYIFNEQLSYCENLNNEKVLGAISFVNNKFSIESNETVFCYFYMDIKPTAVNYIIKNGGLWSSGLPDDGLRYVGTTNVDNYICFGTSDKSACTANPDTYMYRIIGVFDGKIKLIKKISLGNHQWNADYSNDIKWQDCDLNNKLNGSTYLTNTTYVPSGWSDKIATTTWTSAHTKSWNNQGGLSYWGYYVGEGESSEVMTPIKIYLDEFGKAGKPEASITDQETSIKKVGLMNVSDYVLALGNNAINMTGSTSTRAATLKTSWMHISNNQSNAWEWTISRSGLDSYGYFNAWNVNSDGYVNSYYVDDTGGAVRPVLFLNSDSTLKEGTGTIDNPYVIN